MPFETFLGNEQLKKTLSGSISAGHISHFYVISGPVGSGKHTLARLMAAAILCRERQKPCMHCASCRKVLNDAHPDFITVDDPEKKTVPVDLIRDARADMYIRPNEGDRKIYLFPRAQDMAFQGQNALLKVLEEPPAYGVFILLTDNPNKLLPTVRSRCTELKLREVPADVLIARLRQDYPEAEESILTAAAARSGGYYGQAKQLMEAGVVRSDRTRTFVKALCSKDNVVLMQTVLSMEKWKRDALADTLNEWLELTQGALISRCGGDSVSPLARHLGGIRSARELLYVTEELKKAALYCQSNVSPGAVCGYLAWKLRL